MKLGSTIGKNLKLLFRSKESAYTVIFGPILIILIVSFAFMGSTDEYTVRAGAYVSAPTQFADRTIASLNENDYIVPVYPSQETCVGNVSTGENHVCLVFAGDEDSKTVPVTFYLDESRRNIVDQIINDLSGELGEQADVIRRQLATGALSRIETAAELIGDEVTEMNKITGQLDSVSSELKKAKAEIGNLPESRELNVSNLQQLRGFHNGLAQNSRTVTTLAVEHIDEALKILDDLEKDCENCSEGTADRIDNLRLDVKEAKDKMYQISEEIAQDQLFEANLLLEYAIEDVELAEAAIADASSAGAVIAVNVVSSADATESSVGELKGMAGRLEYTEGFLRGETADAETITKPVSTNIVSITVSDDSLSFAYPYLLVLVIMFVGMLLASMLVVTDKISSAAFRNFTTPTSDKYHVIASFVTAFVIIFAEVFLLLLVSTLFVAQPLLLNPLPTLVIIGVAIILFTFIGMIIGYLSNTQEAAMISSITVSSILLFVSNLILPVEAMTRVMQSLTVLNPYIVLSELLKKSMLYGVSAGQVVREMAWLLILVLVLLGITVFIRRRIKQKYFKQEEPLLAVKTHVPKHLRLGEAYVHNEVSLMEALDKMTRQEYGMIVVNDPYMISRWVERELRNKRLARQLRTKSKEKIILKLDKYLARHGKRMKQ